MISNLELLIRLVSSAIAGGIIGMEREARNRPAGLRTHILVTLGSALIMLISMYGFNGFGAQGNGGEPARLAAQVVSGIGFLGAGTIMRNENSVHGLTTAASIWVCGGIGLAFGNGYYFGGIATTLIVLVTLKSMGAVERKLFKKNYRELVVSCKKRVGIIGEIGTIFGNNNIGIRDITVSSVFDEGDASEIVGNINFIVKLPSSFIVEKLFDEILSVEGILSVSWEEDTL